MRWTFTSIVLAGLVVTTGAWAAVGDELAVDEPLEVGARRNVWPADLLVVDRNHDLFADPRVRVVDTVGVTPANLWDTNAKVRAAATPATVPATRPCCE